MAYPQSNGLAELMVKTTKRIVNGNKGPQDSLDNDNVTWTILQYWNTPIQGIGLSPAQLLLHCWLHDSIPTEPILYKPHAEWAVAAQHRKKILHYHNAIIVEKYFPHYKLETQYLSKVHSITSGTLWEKSLPSYQIANTESGLMDQEESHLGTTVSWESTKSRLHWPQYQVQHLYQ